MLLLLTLACQTSEGSWSTVFQPLPAEAPAAETAVEDPMAQAFRDAEALTRQEGGTWGDVAALEEGGAAEVAPAEAPVAEAPAEPAPVEVPVAEEAPAPEPPAEAPPAPVGLPDQPAWGLRLLATLPQANPPRAALGLPDGREVVVAPGTLLPEVGVIVVSVGPDRAQIARVTAAGDHAVIESSTLFAQYAGAAP